MELTAVQITTRGTVHLRPVPGPGQTYAGDIPTTLAITSTTVPPTVDDIHNEDPGATVYRCSGDLFLFTECPQYGTEAVVNAYAMSLLSVLGHDYAAEGEEVYGDAWAILTDQDADHLARFARGVFDHADDARLSAARDPLRLLGRTAGRGEYAVLSAKPRGWIMSVGAAPRHGRLRYAATQLDGAASGPWVEVEVRTPSRVPRWDKWLTDSEPSGRSLYEFLPVAQVYAELRTRVAARPVRHGGEAS